MFKDWRKRTYEEVKAGNQPYPLRLAEALEKGGIIVERVGFSERAVVEMPDGTRLEEGLDHDGAMYAQ